MAKKLIRDTKVQVVTSGSSRSTVSDKVKGALMVIEKRLKKRQGEDLLPPPEDPTTSLVHWCSVYFEVSIKGRSPNSVRAIKNDLQKFLSFYAEAHGHLRAEEWTRAVTEQFIEWLSSRARELRDGTFTGYAPATINRVMATVRSFATFCVNRGAVPHGHPTEGVRDVQTDATRPKSPTKGEVNKLRLAAHRLRDVSRRDQAPLRDIAILEVLVGVGLRATELCGLRVDQLKKRGQQHWLMGIKRKGRRLDDRPLPPKARKALLEYIDDERERLVNAGARSASRAGNLYEAPKWIFLSRNGNQLVQRDLVRVLDHLLDEAFKATADARPHVTPHCLRHYFGQRFHDKFGDVETARALGHSSLSYVSVYNKRTVQEESQMVEELDL